MSELKAKQSMQPAERTESFMAHMDAALREAEALGGRMREAVRAANAFDDAREREVRELEAADAALAAERRAAEAALQPPTRLTADDAERFEVYGSWAADDDASGSTGTAAAAAGSAATATLPADRATDDLAPAGLLGRRTVHGRVYYKVEWRGSRGRIVTWEPASELSDEMITDFERAFRAAAAAPRTSRLRPVAYVTRRQIALNPAVRARVEEERARSAAAGARGVWSCEIEPFVFIPYEEAVQAMLERAFVAGQPHAVVPVAGSRYRVVFSVPPSPPPGAGGEPSMRQFREDAFAGGAAPPVTAGRRVQRVVPLDPEAERRLVAAMSLDELRAYIAALPELLPVHFEALARLHEEDKVVVALSATEVAALPTVRFGQLLERVADGEEVVGFESMCPLCLADYAPDTVLTCFSCSHSCCQPCASDYLMRYSRLCPICKVAI